MDTSRLVNAARGIATRNVNGNIVAVVVDWDAEQAQLGICYFTRGNPSEEEIELCELSFAELNAEFWQVVERGVTKCLPGSPSAVLGSNAWLVYSEEQ